MMVENPPVENNIREIEGDMDNVDLKSPNEGVAANETLDEVNLEDSNNVSSDSITTDEEPIKPKEATDDSLKELETVTESNKTPESTESTSQLPPAITLLNSTEEDDDIQEFPSLPVTPVDPKHDTRKKRHTKMSPSLALSVSSITSTGHQTVSSSVFIKKAMQLISRHKATAKNSTIKAAVTKALSE